MDEKCTKRHSKVSDCTIFARQRERKMMLFPIFLVFLLWNTSLPAQNDWQQQPLVGINDEDAEREDWAQDMEERAERLAHPQNINLATRADLQALGLLDEEQIEDILTFTFVNGPLMSMAELMAVPTLDKRTRKLLSLYFYASPTPVERKDTITPRYLWKHAKHQLTTRIDIPLYYRKGYSVPAKKGGYLGKPIYNKVQYRLTSGRHLNFGLKAEKDAGEPFRHNGGWDSYGGALQLKDLGVLQNLVVGDYKIGFGQGLVINQGYGFGKAYARRTTTGIRPHLGTDEVNFMRGMAVSLRFGKWDVSAWGSHRKLDATLTDGGEVRTLRTSYLHRTNSEIASKGNVRNTTMGANIQWKYHGFHLGGTAYWQHFNRNLEPGTQLYRAYYPRGNTFFVGGINYGWRNNWLIFSGETATNGREHGIATLNQLNWRANVNTTLSVIQRHYGRGYSSFYSSALSDCGAVQNESGGMIRLETMPWNHTQLLAYFDVFRNEWPSRGQTKGRRGQELMLQTISTLHNLHTIDLRYQLKRRGNSDEMEVHHRLRARYRWQTTSTLQLGWMANLHALQNKAGYALSQTLRHETKNKMWRQSFAATWFHTPDYDRRIYVVEPTLRNTFSLPALSGKGIRAVFATQTLLFRQKLRIEARYAVMRILDKSTQGSGMELINSPWRNDVQVQVTWII